MKISHGVALLLVGVAAWTASHAWAQESGSPTAPAAESATLPAPGVTVVELNPPDDVDPDVWIARVIRHAELPEAMDAALGSLSSTDAHRVDELTSAHRGRQHIGYDHEARWLWISAPSVPPKLGADVADALAAGVCERVRATIAAMRARTRAHLDERIAVVSSKLRLAAIDLRKELEDSGSSASSLELEYDRLFMQRKSLGVLLNEYELDELQGVAEGEGEHEAATDAAMMRLREKLAHVDAQLGKLEAIVKRVERLQSTVDRLDELREEALAAQEAFADASFVDDHAVVVRAAEGTR